MIIVIWYITIFLGVLYIAGYFDSKNKYDYIYKPSDVYAEQAEKAMEEQHRQFLEQV